MNAAPGLTFIARAFAHTKGILGPGFATAPAPYVDALALYTQGHLYEAAAARQRGNDV